MRKKDQTSNDPMYPVCLEPIKSSDKVRGIRDDLMHEWCDCAQLGVRPEADLRWRAVGYSGSGWWRNHEGA